MTLEHKKPSVEQQQKDAFLDQLVYAQEQLEAKGIDFRIVGSLASHAYLEGTSKARSLNFNRSGAATYDQRVPDIDLIVPRKDLVETRKLRQELIESSFPVKLGLANPSTEIDFQPTEDASYLTHKSLKLPVSNDIFEARIASIEGVILKTIPLDGLIHTFGTFGGMIRHKDVALIGSLMRHNEEPFEQAKTEVFHEFQRQRRKESPLQYGISRGIEFAERRMSRRFRNEMYRVALKAADILGKR